MWEKESSGSQYIFQKPTGFVCFFQAGRNKTID